MSDLQGLFFQKEGFRTNSLFSFYFPQLEELAVKVIALFYLKDAMHFYFRTVLLKL